MLSFDGLFSSMTFTQFLVQFPTFIVIGVLGFTLSFYPPNLPHKDEPQIIPPRLALLPYETRSAQGVLPAIDAAAHAGDFLI